MVEYKLNKKRTPKLKYSVEPPTRCHWCGELVEDHDLTVLKVPVYATRGAGRRIVRREKRKFHQWCADEARRKRRFYSTVASLIFMIVAIIVVQVLGRAVGPTEGVILTMLILSILILSTVLFSFFGEYESTRD